MNSFVNNKLKNILKKLKNSIDKIKNLVYNL
uniref:Uncharacterized protein n=2 Tax=unclassified Caudoviricetes TaxID=2788787 RepID=A0A8S5NH93_9CAUD|nr:MAG TPA: hypothetical protein [Siphoviridae sp. ctUF252]DAE01508.1 MAG TPA: hypothetical protein [Siphoviridae sp. ctZHt25]